MELFRGPAENDPRMTQGPCEKKHVDEKINPETKDKADFDWGGSQYGLWVHCPVCDLRLGYWPKEQWTGKYAMSINPAVVEQALQEIKKKGHWETCTAEMVKIEIGKVELNRREKTLEAKATLIESQKTEWNNREEALEKHGARGSRTARSTGQASPLKEVVHGPTRAEMESQIAEMESQIADLKRELKEATLKIEEASKALWCDM